MCYQDDFVGLKQTKSRADQAYARLLQLASLLILMLAPDKYSPPVTSLVWLGIRIDTVEMTVSLPQEKVAEVLEDCKQWRNKTRASHKQIQSLAGKLQHLAKCVRPAARFLNRILAALCTTPFTCVHQFDPDMRKDIEWFERFAFSFDCILIIPSQPRVDNVSYEYRILLLFTYT